MYYNILQYMLYIYIYIHNCIYNSKNSRVRLYGHLIATPSFMPHARQSSGDCQKKRLHSNIFENSEQYNTY